MRASAGNSSARLTESISCIQLNAGLGHLLGSELQCVSDARREGRSMQHAHSGTRLIVGEGRGGWLGVSAVPCWSVSASLLSVHVCHSFDPLDSQDGKITEKLRPKEGSHCRLFWRSTSVQITSRQEDPEGEDELEPAFQVESPQAIGRRTM